MYTVFSDAHELYPAATGLKLAEAWTLMMALSGCDYAFERDGAGAMRLLLWNNLEMAAERVEEPMNDGRDWSVYSSNFPDNAIARAAIMRCFVGDGVRGVRLLTDEEFRAEKTRTARNAEGERRKPANGSWTGHRLDVEFVRRANATRESERRRWASRNTAGR
ncbi:MAG TPA: hypothetical protein VMF67_00285 [Rhizomicrobium sp.]|nr:hypothetical protein [Rhizomicrobium sp.]